MASVSEIKKRLQQNSINQTTKEDDEKSLNFSSDYNRIKNRVKTYGLIHEDMNDDYIDSFLKDASNFVNSAPQEFESIGFSTASSAYEQRFQQSSDISSRAKYIRSWLNANKENIEDQETYNSLMSSLDEWDKASSVIHNQFSAKKNYFSNWETEDDYNKWYEEEKRKEELRNVDLKYEANQISILELDFENMKNLRSKINDLYNELNVKEHQLGEQKHRVDLTVDSNLQKEIEDLRAELESAKSEYEQSSSVLGNADAIESKLNDLRSTYESAKELQETEALTTDALNAPDLEEFSQKGIQWGQDTYQGGFLNLGTYNNGGGRNYL